MLKQPGSLRHGCSSKEPLGWGLFVRFADARRRWRFLDKVRGALYSEGPTRENLMRRAPIVNGFARRGLMQQDMSNPSVPGITDQSQALSIDDRIRIMRDGLINYSGYLVSAVVSVILIPILLRGLGGEPYGLWIAALALGGVLASWGLGLFVSVTREVAACPGEKSNETVAFVQAAGNICFLFGLVGALLIFTLGLPLSSGLHLSAQNRKVAVAVFGLAGLNFFADQMLAFAMAVLVGLRRFVASNLTFVAMVLSRAFGIVVLVGAGAGLVTVAAWQTLSTAAAALAALVVVGRLAPPLALRLGRPDWRSLRPHVSFSLMSQLIAVGSRGVFEGMLLIIGVVLGSASVASYYIGQRFPLAISAVTFRMAEAFFPAASEQARTPNLARTGALLEVGTRWAVILTLPLSIVLWFLAPNLMQAWVGGARPEMVLVLRLTTAALFAQAIGVSAQEVLWSQGAVRTVLSIVAGFGALHLILGVWLLGWLGIAGGAWALCFNEGLCLVFFLWYGLRLCDVQLGRLIRVTFGGLTLPAIACTVTTFGVTALIRPSRWPAVIGAALASGMAYAATIYFGEIRAEEQKLVREIIRVPAEITLSAYRGVRRLFLK